MFWGVTFIQNCASGMNILNFHRSHLPTAHPNAPWWVQESWWIAPQSSESGTKWDKVGQRDSCQMPNYRIAADGLQGGRPTMVGFHLFLSNVLNIVHCIAEHVAE